MNINNITYLGFSKIMYDYNRNVSLKILIQKRTNLPVAHWHLNVVPSLVVQIPPLKQGFAG